MKCTLATLMLVMSMAVTTSFAQQRYVTRTTNFGPANILEATPVDNLGQLLAYGYLTGKLKAYRFAFSDSVKTWKMIDTGLEEWSKSVDYYAGDHILYHGKAYQALMDVGRRDKSPVELSQFWEATGAEHEPVSHTLYFPSDKDTISRSEFLNRMVSYAGDRPVQWDATNNYYEGELVSYKGSCYESISKNTGQTPPDHPGAWGHTNRCDVEFARLSALNTASVLFNYTVAGTDTTWNPQMITIVNSHDGGDWTPVLDFYFADAIGYLNSIHQPLIPSGYAYAGNSFILPNDGWPALPNVIKNKIRSKEIKGKVVDAKFYKYWLSDTTTVGSGAEQAQFDIFQDLSTNDLIVTIMNEAGDENWSSPILRVSPTYFDKLKVSVPKLQPLPYSNALLNFSSYGPPREVSADSLLPLQPKVALAAGKKTYSFMVDYYVRLAGDGNKDLNATIQKIWGVVDKAFYAHALKQQGPVTTFFDAPVNWDALNPWHFWNDTYTLRPGFTLGSSWTSRDSIPSGGKCGRLAVTYRKKINPDGTPLIKNFDPYQIKFRWIWHIHGEPIFEDIAFSWSDLKAKILENKSSQTEAFIQSVETGKLPFNGSEIVYGLREE